MTISEILIINHTHTDIGYTDHPENLFRHHNKVIDNAFNLVEQYDSHPDESKFRWTCETSMITADWFRQASSADQDRFRDYFARGLVDVGAMPLNWTPLISPANAIHSLKHVHFLRSEGINPTVALQCDINGLAWHWTDLLLNIGVDSFVTQPNPHRGAPFIENQRIFNWRTPSGADLFTLHGWHYSVGVVSLFFGDNDPDHTQARLDVLLAKLEARKQYPYSKALLAVTNQASVDNGYATKRMPEFVENWNAANRFPKLRLVTLAQAVTAIKEDVAQSDIPLPVHRGDWSDYWVDGVGSTAYETAINRTAARLLPAIDTLTSFTENSDTSVLELAAKEIQLYDEHTWGATCSISLPESPFTRFGEISKKEHAHLGLATALDATHSEAVRRARIVTDDAVEGDHHIRPLDRVKYTSAASPFRPTHAHDQSYYVMNPTSVARRITWPVTVDTLGGLPETFSDAYVSNRFLPGMQMQKFAGKAKESHVISVDLPAFGEAVVKPIKVNIGPDVRAGENWIENKYYKLVINSEDGSLESFLDTRSGVEYATADAPIGQVLYETLTDPKKDRTHIFGDLEKWDWTLLETLVWPDGPGYDARAAGQVEIGQSRITATAIEIQVILTWEHGDKATLTYRLPHDRNGIEVDMYMVKLPVDTPESMYMTFGIPGEKTKLYVDIGDHAIKLGDEQIPTSCLEWISVQEFATVSTEVGSLVVVPLDTPLVQPYGIQTQNAGHGPIGRDPKLAFWMLNNHWDTNFAIRQSGGFHARFRVLPQTDLDLGAAGRFAKAACTPPAIIRAYDATPVAAKQLLSIDGSNEVIVRTRKAWNGNSVIATLVNPTSKRQKLKLALPQHKVSNAEIVSAIEEPLGGLFLNSEDGKSFALEVDAGETIYICLYLS